MKLRRCWWYISGKIHDSGDQPTTALLRAGLVERLGFSENAIQSLREAGTYVPEHNREVRSALRSHSAALIQFNEQRQLLEMHYFTAHRPPNRWIGEALRQLQARGVPVQEKTVNVTYGANRTQVYSGPTAPHLKK